MANYQLKKIFPELIIIFLLLLNTIAGASEMIITAIEVQGNYCISEATILKAASAKLGDPIDETSINADLRAIFSLGYFEDVKARFEDYKNGKKVLYEVKETPLINQIIISGNSVYSSAEIISLLKSKSSQLLNYKLLRDDIDLIKGKYINDGYILTEITDVKTDPDTNNLYFNISEVTVQGITIEGTQSTKDYVIFRELKTKVGSVFNEKTLNSDLRRVYNLEYFSEITPLFEAGTKKDQLIIILKIKEARTSTINFGGGYGQAEGAFGFIDLSVNNLLCTAQNILLKGQTGQNLGTYQFKYFNPWFMPQRLGDRTSLTFRMWNTYGRDIIVTQQDEFHVGMDAAIGKELNDNFKTSFSFGSEFVSPRGSATFEAYNSHFVGAAFSYDTRDVWSNPSQGAYHTISLKQGWKITAGETTNYTKYGVDLNRFTPLRERLVFAWHLGGGLGAGDLPLGELYWVGGPNTVRGYNFDEIQKGTRRILANLELRYTFNETLQGVFFFDWGSAWSSGLPIISDFIASWGPGIRINTPLGPIRLDYGIKTHKGFGEGKIEFSIGQAF